LGILKGLARDTMIGVAAARETVNSIAGHPARDTPFAAELIALAMTVYASRAAYKQLRHAVRPAFRRIGATAHTVRAVMRRWGISPSNIQLSPAANSDAVGEHRARRGAVASGYKQKARKGSFHALVRR